MAGWGHHARRGLGSYEMGTLAGGFYMHSGRLRSKFLLGMTKGVAKPFWEVQVKHLVGDGS
jgi:hypothetical protein